MSHVIEHLTDPVEELKILNKCLKSDGVFVCALPIYSTLGWNLRRKYVYYDVPRHRIHLTNRTLFKLFERAGFEIRKKIVVPYSWGFFFSDFKKFCNTGKPGDCHDGNIGSTPIRHKIFGYVSWLLRSTGNVCVYAIRKQ